MKKVRVTVAHRTDVMAFLEKVVQAAKLNADEWENVYVAYNDHVGWFFTTATMGPVEHEEIVFVIQKDGNVEPYSRVMGEAS